MSAPATHSPAWHAIRSEGVGASEVAPIVGIGPGWSSAYSLWLEKTGRYTPDPFDASEAMDMGLELEPFLASAFTTRTGLVVAGVQRMITHPEHPWARATVDGLVIEGGAEACGVSDALGGFEAKYDNHGTWEEVPAHYTIQANWQMFVAGWEKVWFGVLHPFGRYRVYEVDRDQELIDACYERVSAFWHDNVLADVAPPLDGFGRKATATALGAVFGEGGGGETDVSDLEEQLASLRYLKAETKALKEQIVDLENVVKAGLGAAEIGLVVGQVAVTWKRTVSRRLDAKRHQQDSPECHKQFVSESSSRRLIIKGAADD